MKHQTFDELQSIADINPMAPALLMTRVQRIERWAELLEMHPSRCLAALTGTEHLYSGIRDEARATGSPITVAFDDPVLRASGLKSDTYGEAKRFFELSDWQLHEIVCSCHAGATMRSDWAAGRVRGTLGGSKVLAWLKRLMAHG
ncbi:hypothetical protein OOJ09_27645 [Mesorhizobium qingshengii]|jgi:hypothetical protein|uniref:Uncharacterized protein n=1 Tax=Mesorhizobium qingshengii TaxID=1165689 RepID=A0ABT4R2A4_9HYPH|nr:hypothetical protein [Mesorhizobium qingshengii]MCZ8547968.1 hypothetical protein [Mesorhizobium qingshengii]